MRLILLTLLLGFTVLAAQAQDTKNVPAQANKPNNISGKQLLLQHYYIKYQAAMRYNDYAVAKNALFDILVEVPQNDSILYSLSLLYYQSNQFASAVLTAKDVQSINPDNVGALEIEAVSLENLGIKDKALESYESLYLKTDSYETLYKVAFLQYDLKNYAQSKTNADILLSKKESEEATTVFSTADNEQKEYPIKAAIYNLKGLIAKAEGNKAEARKNFQEALKISPEFTIAKENLASVEK